MAPRPASACAALLVKACVTSADIRTVDELAVASHMSLRTFQRKCAAHGIRAKQALDFVRCAASVLRRREWSDETLFSDLDPRTSARLRARAALVVPAPPSLEEFIARQRCIDQPRLRDEILFQFTIADRDGLE